MHCSPYRKIQKTSKSDEHKNFHSHRIKKCSSNAIFKNTDAVELKENIVAIPYHLFGNHQKCDVSCCRYLQNPDSYVPKYLSN